MLHKINLHNITSWILPRLCAACGMHSDVTAVDLCSYCKVLLPWRQESCYHCCRLLLRANEAIICEKCQDSLPLYNRICALFDYEPPLPRLIGTLKFGKQLYPAQIFGMLLAEAVTKRWYRKESLPQVIIPVPLHNKRLAQRGYNQAAEICRPLSKSLNIPLHFDFCQRIKHTSAQSKLKRAQRVRNLAAAFRVNEKYLQKNVVRYKHVAVVDDVVTTGSTIRAICTVLLAAGVETIDVWCVCRA